jgi:hypothetical protein
MQFIFHFPTLKGVENEYEHLLFQEVIIINVSIFDPLGLGQNGNPAIHFPFPNPKGCEK